MLTAIGLPELITATSEDYEALAVELATSPLRLAEIRARLQKNRLTAPLFDMALFTRHLEEVYWRIYRRYQEGLRPEHVFIGA